MSDTINHPPHYTDGKIEVIDYIEDKSLGYHLGNVVKYVSRAGKKTSDPLEDLKKAQWYLDRYIKIIEKKVNCKYKDSSPCMDCLHRKKEIGVYPCTECMELRNGKFSRWEVDEKNE